MIPFYTFFWSRETGYIINLLVILVWKISLLQSSYIQPHNLPYKKLTVHILKIFLPDLHQTKVHQLHVVLVEQLYDPVGIADFMTLEIWEVLSERNNKHEILMQFQQGTQII